MTISRSRALVPVSPPRQHAEAVGARKPSKAHKMRVLRDLEDWLEGPMRVLSVIWLALLLCELVWPRRHLLRDFGTAIWVVFIVDFALRIWLAPHKLAFLKRRWLMAIALIVPAFRFFAFLGALRFLSIARPGQLIILIGAANRAMNTFRRGLARRKVLAVSLITLVVTLLGAGGMYAFEPHAVGPGQAGFAGYMDALWFTAMLMTTIGSAYWPVTAAGRVLAFLLSIFAVGVFGYLTAALSSIFVGQDAEASDGPVAGADDIAALRAEIAGLRADLKAGASAPSV